MKQTITIELNKTKLLFATVGSLAFVGLGVNLWIIAYAQTRYAPLGMRIAGAACILLFGFYAIAGFVKLFDRKPGIRINHEGISIIGNDFIHWSVITDYSIAQIGGTKIFLLYVENPKEYIAAANNLKRIRMRLTMKLYNTPLGISSNRYKCSFDELKNAILEGMKNHALSKRNK